MKNFRLSLITILIFLTVLAQAQIGIGTSSPDASAVLDLSSDSKGLLIPRMTTAQRILISNPATGLLIYNTTNNDLETNTGTSLLPNWNGSKSGFETVSDSTNTSTISLIDELLSGMILNPSAGTYSVTFNSQYNNAQLMIASTPQIISDLDNLYNELRLKPVTNSTHLANFGNATTAGEIVTPGVYTIVGAATLTTNITFDANGDPNALFIVRVQGALSSASLATIFLANEAKAKNIFWVIEGAISLGAGTIMKGILISHGHAIACASGTVLEGRLFTTEGALTFGPGIASIPLGTSIMNLGMLSSYVFFSGMGNISNTAVSNYSGDIGTANGLTAGFGSALVNGIIRNSTNFDTVGELVDNNNRVAATFSIYQNGHLIPSSLKILSSSSNTANISLQAIATINSGEPIEVKWKTGSDKLEMGNRILTIIKIQ